MSQGAAEVSSKEEERMEDTSLRVQGRLLLVRVPVPLAGSMIEMAQVARGNPDERKE